VFKEAQLRGGSKGDTEIIRIVKVGADYFQIQVPRKRYEKNKK